MTAGDSQAPARNKIILKIDHNQSLHLSFLSTFFKILPIAVDEIITSGQEFRTQANFVNMRIFKSFMLGRKK